MKTPTKKQPAKRKVASKPQLPLSLVKQAMQSPEAARASRALHGALNDALAILAPVHGQDLAQTLVGEIISGTPPPADQPTTPRPPVSATLSPPASELVRWYCAITHHHETDAVEGAVFGVLERARDAHEGPLGGDEGFNFILEDVLRAMNDDSRQSAHRRYGGGYTVQMDIEASELLNRYQQATGCDLRDIVSACVAYTLTTTFENQEESITHSDRPGYEAENGRRYHDGAWGYTREWIDDATDRRKECEAESERRNAATAAYAARKEGGQ